MKILLAAINAKYIHSNPAVYLLKAYAGEWKEQIETAEYTINQLPESILADIYNRKPDVVAFSCYIWNWTVVKGLLCDLPKVLPGVKLWLGGPEVSYDADRLLAEYPQLAGIMVGEGEETFAELCAYYCSGQEDNRPRSSAQEVSCPGGGSPTEKLKRIAGLCLPKYGYTGTRKPIDMDTIPFFYEDLSAFEHKILYYESSRGCPFSCSYCLSSIDKKVRFRSVGLVKKELQFFLDRKVAQVKFVDRTFNCDHTHACAIWRYLLEHDNGVTNFHFEISADLLNEEELALLSAMRPGLVQLEIGVQSTNGDTIKEIRRTMDLSRLKSIVERIHAGHNIHEHLDLIAGLPYEDFKSFSKSFNEVYDMHPDQLQMGFLKVLKGSYMESMTKNYELSFSAEPPYEVLKTKWLSYGDVLRLKKVCEMVELYYNSGQFSHTLSALRTAFESPFAMYEALAEYYEKCNLFLRTPSRIYRYEALLSFAKEHDGKREDLYRELLTFDLYLRERVKSRPSFARDKAPGKDEILLLEEMHPDMPKVKKTAHVEAFFNPVWDEKAVAATETADADPAKKPRYYVVFDYEQRDPLSNNAQIAFYC